MQRLNGGTPEASAGARPTWPSVVSALLVVGDEDEPHLEHESAYVLLTRFEPVSAMLRAWPWSGSSRLTEHLFASDAPG